MPLRLSFDIVLAILLSIGFYANLPLYKQYLWDHELHTSYYNRQSYHSALRRIVNSQYLYENKLIFNYAAASSTARLQAHQEYMSNSA